ncbi:hypothetical protein DZC71_05990, partial [Campylobacter hepaticus]|uniref:hypothetical protein n=1 Tax=Campylobacter hepaticus TaxID=1813019 RepID=UPI000F53CA19
MHCSSSSTKLVLSLAAISFFNSYSTAEITGPNCTGNTCTITNDQTGTIQIQGHNSTNSLTIQKDATLTNTANLISITEKAIHVYGSNTDMLNVTTILNKGTINGKVTVENKGDFTGTIHVNNLSNEGTINGNIYIGIWRGNEGNIIIDNFENTKDIHSPNVNGVFFEGNVQVKNFNNKGTIIGATHASGVKIAQKNDKSVTIENFNNEGTIGSKDSVFGIMMHGSKESKPIITNFNNSGKLLGANKSVFIKNGIIINFNNTGIIDSKHNAIVLQTGSKINTLNNNGTIKAQSHGISFIGSNQDEENIIDQIILEENSNIQAGKNAINVNLIGNKTLAIGSINVKKGAKVHGDKAGIYVGPNQKITGQIVVSGELSGKEADILNEGIIAQNIINTSLNDLSIKNQTDAQIIKGISNTNSAKLDIDNKDQANISKWIINKGLGKLNIKNKDHASITAAIINADLGKLNLINSSSQGISGIITNEDSGELNIINNAKINANILNNADGYLSIENKDDENTDASIKGNISNNAKGILVLNNQKGASILGNISNQDLGVLNLTNQYNANIVGDISNRGLGTLNLTNSSNAKIIGDISNNANGNINLHNKKNATILGAITNEDSGNITLNNTAIIAKGINNTGLGTINITNTGFIGTNDKGYNVFNEGQGNIHITSWTLRTGNDNKLQTLKVGGKSANSVMVENLIVDQSNLNMDELNDINNLVSGVSLNNIKKIKTNGSGEMILSYDALSGKISTDFNLNASIIGASFRALNASYLKRASFIDNILGFNIQSFNPNNNLYTNSNHNYYTHDNIKEHALVILPYFSSQSVELSLNEKSKGHIKGNILAYSTLKESGTYSFYAGYEDTKMNSYYFDVKNRTYYTGIKYFNTLFYTDNNQEVYIKAQAK